MLTTQELKTLNNELRKQNLEVIGFHSKYEENYHRLRKKQESPFMSEDDFLPITKSFIILFEEIIPNRKASFYKSFIYFE